jgi:hypothetical protein
MTANKYFLILNAAPLYVNFETKRFTASSLVFLKAEQYAVRVNQM